MPNFLKSQIVEELLPEWIISREEKGALATGGLCNTDPQVSHRGKGVFLHRKEQTRLQRTRAGNLGWKGDRNRLVYWG